MGARTCCSVISRVVPRSKIKIPVWKPPANEFGNALLRVAGAWVPLSSDLYGGLGPCEEATSKGKAPMGLDAMGLEEEDRGDCGDLPKSFHLGLLPAVRDGDRVCETPYEPNEDQLLAPPVQQQGWTGCLFFVGRRKGADIPEWDFPVRVVEPLRKADMAPFLIQGAAAASQSLNTVGVNHAEGYLTEYKLVKYKLSHAWDDEEVAAGRGQKEMAKYAKMIPVSLYLTRLDEDVSARGPAQKAKAVARGGAVKEALETEATAGAVSLPQPKRKEKRKAALVESQAGGCTSEEEVSNEPRARKKKKAMKSMPRIAGSAAEVEEEEEDLEPLLA
ncbi:hypothetical protein Taro_055077 [Colocasia esculenta]|uniref:Uncharacterized protein n=1 Tax=Colocasia esculenta TaxID=4460 RepID=A0A843XSI1_COLES|nr:hypothetical protein [Colocasia esculenta]